MVKSENPSRMYLMSPSALLKSPRVLSQPAGRSPRMARMFSTPMARYCSSALVISALVLPMQVK